MKTPTFTSALTTIFITFITTTNFLSLVIAAPAPVASASASADEGLAAFGGDSVSSSSDFADVGYWSEQGGDGDGDGETG